MRLAGKDIVVADDNVVLLRLLAAILEEAGWEVRTACDGFAVLRAMRDRAPDVLLSDLNMPGMSGFELLSVVRRKFPSVYVIAMSGSYSGESVPPDVAADGFYAKGCNSLTRLFNLLECTSRALPARASTPIWMPTMAERKQSLLSCPECLRAFSQSSDRTTEQDQTAHCPYCAYSFRITFVQGSGSVDDTMPREIHARNMPAPPCVSGGSAAGAETGAARFLHDQHPA